MGTKEDMIGAVGPSSPIDRGTSTLGKTNGASSSEVCASNPVLMDLLQIMECNTEGARLSEEQEAQDQITPVSAMWMLVSSDADN